MIALIIFTISISLVSSYYPEGAIGNAIQKAKKLQSELELQLDTAVGVDESNKGDTDTEIRSQTVTPEGPVMEGWQG